MSLKRKKLAAFTFIVGLLSASSISYGDDISTVAGTGVAGYSGDGAAATAALIDQPFGIAVASNGDVYIADRNNNVVRMIDNATGDISTIAGGGSLATGDGAAATSGWLNTPQNIVVNAAGDIYIADTNNHRIRKVDVGTGFISTIAGTGVQGYSAGGGVATNAQLDQPKGIAVDSAGNVIFSDTNNHRIRMITPGGAISTVAGTGTNGFSGDTGAATAAQIDSPHGIAIDTSDNIYFADEQNDRVRKFTVGGNISTVAGNGTSAFAGDGGAATSASFQLPKDVAVDEAGTLGYLTAFATQQGSLKDDQNATQVTIADSATVNSITAYISSNASKDVRYALYADAAGEPDTLVVETAATTAPNTTGWFTIATAATPIAAGTYWLALSFDANSQKCYVNAAGGQSRENNNAAVPGGYSDPWGASSSTDTWQISIYATYTLSNNVVYVADTDNHRVRKFTEGGNISTFAGDGTNSYGGDGGAATAAQLNEPLSVSLNSSDDLFIADSQNHCIRMVDSSTAFISTYGGTGSIGYTGDGGAATAAAMYEPHGVFVDSSDNVVLADTLNHVIRSIDFATGDISVVAGTPRDMGVGDGSLATSVFLDVVEDVAVDSSDNLFISCPAHGRVRRVDAGTGVITTVIGSGFEFEPGVATDDVLLLSPSGIAVDSSDNILVADSDSINSRVVQYTLVGATYATVAGTGTAGYSGDGAAATLATINLPQGIDLDFSDNLYIADAENHRIRKVDNATGDITTIAGTGVGGYSGDAASATAAQINSPQGLVADYLGNVYIADTNNSRIRKITIADGNINSIAGTGTAGFSGDGADATLAQVNLPRGIALSGTNDLYLCDTDNERVRMIDQAPLSPSKIVSWQEIEP